MTYLFNSLIFIIGFTLGISFGLFIINRNFNYDSYQEGYIDGYYQRKEEENNIK